MLEKRVEEVERRGRGKRFYTRERIRGKWVSHLAKLPILIHDWWSGGDYLI